ncbi:DUF6508 domain-containing protein [Pseudomonas sp. 3A(2025)]
MPPALAPLEDTRTELSARYQAFIDSGVSPDQACWVTEGQQLALDLHAHAVNLSYSKAYENSFDIYWLMQGAATVSLWVTGSHSAEFQGYHKDVHFYENSGMFADQVRLFDHYVTRQAGPQLADIDELLSYLPRLYPNGVAIKTSFFTADSEWPSYVEVVNAFYTAAGQDCWTDFEYDMQRTGEKLRDAEHVANASLLEIKTLLTWCVRGERFCDGHHGSMIEKGYILHLLRRLAVLRQETPATHPSLPS